MSLSGLVSQGTRFPGYGQRMVVIYRMAASPARPATRAVATYRGLSSENSLRRVNTAADRDAGIRIGFDGCCSAGTCG
jgi:hypothetical protein